jgi:hypothetical protein
MMTTIQDFVKTKLNVLPPFHLSPSSKSFLKSLYDIAINTEKPLYKTISQNKPCLPNKPFPKGQILDTMNDYVKSHVYQMNKSVTEIQLSVGSRIYNIHFVCKAGITLKIDHYLTLMNIWLHIASRFADPNCSKVVNVYLYLTEMQKLLPAEFGETIDVEHVNTAFTTKCYAETEILIFRKEEWFKVFIHESFHNLGLDFDSSAKNKRFLRSIFPLQSNCLLEETYCEFWAELLNILVLNSVKKTPWDRVYINVERQIQIERKFSIFQSSKILDYFDLNYVELFEKSPESEQLRKDFKEDTEVFCYYILKTILLYHCNACLEWIFVNFKGSIRFEQDKSDQFITEMILRKHDDAGFIKTIEKVQSLFDKPRAGYIFKTLRMTVLDL